jgi:hypothetical protein
MTRKAAMAAAGLGAIALVGYVDGRSSAYVAFSIFYVIPIAAVTWVAGVRSGALAVLASVVAGFASDVLTIHAPIGYAVWNLGNRVLLFGLITILLARLRRALDNERRLAERERELGEVKTELMRRVAEESRVPLGEMSAKLVNLGFDADTMSTEEIRALLSEFANASARLSSVVERLADDRSPAAIAAGR